MWALPGRLAEGYIRTGAACREIDAVAPAVEAREDITANIRPELARSTRKLRDVDGSRILS